MLRIIVTLLIVSGVCMLIFGLIFKPLKIATGFAKRKSKNTKNLLSFLESITSIRIIQKPLDFLTRDKELWTNKLLSRILELSEVGISSQQIYFLKIVCFSLCTILVLGISYTNMTYQAKLIVESSSEEYPGLPSDDSYGQSRYLLYKQVVTAVGTNKLSKLSEAEKHQLIKEKMAECLNTSDRQLIDEMTTWFIKAWRDVQSLRLFKYYHVLIILLSLFLPEFLLTLRWLLRGCVYKKEIIKLEYIFELLARVDGIKTLDIIYELEKSSKIYSKVLHDFGEIFKYDKKRAFEYIKNKDIKSLSKLANVLEMYCLSDKEIALQVLEREVMERDESIIFTADETLDFIDLVAFLSIVPLVYELTRLMLNPMLDVVYKAFEFI